MTLNNAGLNITPTPTAIPEQPTLTKAATPQWDYAFGLEADFMESMEKSAAQMALTPLVMEINKPAYKGWHAKAKKQPPIRQLPFEITVSPHFIERTGNTKCPTCIGHKYAVAELFDGIHYIHTNVGGVPGHFLHRWRRNYDIPRCIVDWQLVKEAPQRVPGAKQFSWGEL